MKIRSYQTHITVEHDSLVSTILDDIGYKDNKVNKRNVSSIVANATLFRNRRMFRKSLGANCVKQPRWSKYNPLGLTRTSLNQAIKDMRHSGYFYIEDGSYGRSSIVLLKDKMKTLLDQIHETKLAESFEYIKVRVNGELVEYQTESELFTSRRKFLVEYNAYIGQHSIQHPRDYEFKVHPRFAYCVFNSTSEEHGGRLYAPWQRVGNSEQRKLISIDDQKNVELDFDNMNVAIAYAQEGIQLTEDSYNLDADLTRKQIKLLFITMFGTETVAGAVGATVDAIRKKDKLGRVDYTHIRRELYKAGRQIIEDHPAIRDWLLQGKKMPLRFHLMDSVICFEILEQMMKRDIVCLSVHDSFLVPEQHKNTLRSVMEQAFMKYQNGVKPKIS